MLFFPLEFYFKFSAILGSDLVSVRNSGFSSGTLPRSQQRGIGKSVAFICDSLYYCSLSRVPAALIFLDQEKGFDRVDWTFLSATFHSMCLGQPVL